MFALLGKLLVGMGLPVETDARRGNLFPLPRPCSVEARPLAGLSRGVRARVQLRRKKQEAMIATVSALNCMAEGGDQEVTGTCFGSAPASDNQRAVFREVEAAANNKPMHVDKEATLRTLLHVGAEYGTTGILAKYGSAEVSLPLGQSAGVKLESLLDGDALLDVGDVKNRMLLSAEERQAELDASGPPRTYHDPILSGSRIKYVNFLKDLASCGMIYLGPMPRCKLGFFFVTKKDGRLRLIVDARVANTFFRRPPNRRNR